MNKDPIIIHSCGPSSTKCICRCTAEKRDCEHIFDGDPEEFEMGHGAIGWSVTCSRCGMSAMSHDLWCAQ